MGKKRFETLRQKKERRDRVWREFKNDLAEYQIWVYIIGFPTLYWLSRTPFPSLF
jgi:hypothetical protein